MTISNREIEFYESRCVIRDVKKSGPTYSLKLLCEGEGQTFQRSFVGTLIGKNALVVKNGITYQRCS